MSKLQIIPTTFTVKEQVLKGNFVLPTSPGPFPGICKFHGLPGSPDQVHGFAASLAEAGFAVLTFDFRGFRSSEGQFRLAGEVQDAQAAVTHLLDSEYVFKDWVGVYGASYGGAVAVLAAVRDPRISAVCLRAPVFDTLAFAKSPLIVPAVKELLQSMPDVIHGFTDPITRKQILQQMITDAEELNPINEVSKIAPRPLFVITGDADEGIPVDGVRHFFGLAKEPKELVVVKGADHSLTDPHTFQITANEVVAWFQRVKTK